MKIKELAEECQSCLRVLSAYNGKVLCYRYDKEKHVEIGERELCSFWAEMITTKSTSFGNYAVPIVFAYADGAPEYDKEMAKT